MLSKCELKNPREIFDFTGILVREAGLEPARPE